MMTRILPTIALILAIGLFFGYINPTRTGNIAATKAQIASYDSALAAAERFKQKENELIIAEAAIPQEDLARLNDFLPDGVNNVQIILDLNTLAAKSGITLSNFDTTEQGSTGPQGGQSQPTGTLLSEGPIDSIEITMSATGSYEAFRTFLEGIERSLRLLDVVSVSVQNSETRVYTYNMTVRLYWLR